ncbi:hypothetical protein [Cryptosporangium minutisporangium]
MSDPHSESADDVWWSWCRMPNAVRATRDDARTVAVLPHVVPRLGEVLGRELDSELVEVGARQALLDALR